MALTSVSYTATPGQDEFTITFPFLLQAHVSVTVDEVAQTLGVDFSIDQDGTTVTFGTPLAGGEEVVLQRATPSTALWTFNDGTTLRKSELDTLGLQTLYKLQETIEGVLTPDQLNIILTENGNLPDPVNDDGLLQVVAGLWTERTPAEVKTSLGLGTAAEEDVGTAVGDVPQLDDVGGGTPGLPAVDGSNLTGIDESQVAGLGTAAVEDVGTDVGDVVQLEDVGGNAGLPAVDGSQLTNLPQSAGLVTPAEVVLDYNDNTTNKTLVANPGDGWQNNRAVCRVVPVSPAANAIKMKYDPGGLIDTDDWNLGFVTLSPGTWLVDFEATFQNVDTVDRWIRAALTDNQDSTSTVVHEYIEGAPTGTPNIDMAANGGAVAMRKSTTVVIASGVSEVELRACGEVASNLLMRKARLSIRRISDATS